MRSNHLLLLFLAMMPMAALFTAEELPPHPLAAGVEKLAAEIPDFLASNEAQDRAWAAYRAGQLQLTELAPQLRDALVTTLGAEDSKGDPSVIYLVDALLRLGDDGLEPAAMALLLERHPRLGVILAARKPEVHQAALLALVESPAWSAEKIAAVNLLVGIKNQAVFARLLDRLPVQLVVRVVDPGALFAGFGSARGSIHDSGFLIQREGLPPPIAYSLSTGPIWGGWSLLVDGPLTVSYRRREGTAHFFGSGSQVWLPGTYGLEWAARVLNQSSLRQLPISQRPAALVVLDEEPDLVAAIHQRLDQQQERFRQLVRQLVDAGYLGDTYAEALTPLISVLIDDQRQHKDPPLPALPADWTLIEAEGEEP